MRKVLISACLMGVPCRWHGRAIAPSRFVQRWLQEHDAEPVLICPEEMGGLPTPRPPAKRRNGRVYETCAAKYQRRYVTGRDITAAFQRGAEAALTIAKESGCKTAILCKYSPSCDKAGITGKRLVEQGIKVINTF